MNASDQLQMMAALLGKGATPLEAQVLPPLPPLQVQQPQAQPQPQQPAKAKPKARAKRQDTFEGVKSPRQLRGTIQLQNEAIAQSLLDKLFSGQATLGGMPVVGQMPQDFIPLLWASPEAKAQLPEAPPGIGDTGWFLDKLNAKEWGMLQRWMDPKSFPNNLDTAMQAGRINPELLRKLAFQEQAQPEAGTAPEAAPQPKGKAPAPARGGKQR
jgi:hypothetical protein